MACVFSLLTIGSRLKVRLLGRSANSGSSCFADGFDAVERQAEVFEDALSHFEAADGFLAGPVEDAVQVAAFAEFEQDLGNIAGRAGLADFVAEELGALAAPDCCQ